MSTLAVLALCAASFITGVCASDLLDWLLAERHDDWGRHD